MRKIFLETAVHFTESKFALPRVAALEQHIKEFGAKHVVDPLPVTDDFDATIEKRAVKRRALHQEMLTKVLEQIQSTSNNGHWRFQLLSGHILGMIAREDVYVRRDVLAYFLENATSEMLPLRQASVGALGRMMYNIKKRSLQQAAADSVSEGAYKRTVMDYDKPIADYVGQLIVREMTEKEWEARYSVWRC